MVLPLSGTVATSPPILTPLATDLVPLGTSLQSPPTNAFDFPSLVTPSKLILALPLVAFASKLVDASRIQTCISFCSFDSLAIDNPNGRSPPSA
jgi:hypothetical protein